MLIYINNHLNYTLKVHFIAISELFIRQFSNIITEESFFTG